MGDEFTREISTLENIDLDLKLEYHLQCNHYPPVHTCFIPAFKEAIENANLGDWNKEVQLPNGKVLKTGVIIEEMHLEFFLDNPEEY